MCVYYLFYFIVLFIFFFKQKTAYEMRISDWSSDVCSSDLGEIDRQKGGAGRLAKRSRTANTLIRRLLDEDSVAIKTKKKGPVVVVESGKIGRASCRERVCQYV